MRWSDRIKNVRSVSVLSLFFFCFQCVGLYELAHAEETILLVCSGSSNCKSPRRGREDKATHLGFTVKKARGLLTELKTLRRIDKREKELQKAKLKTREEQLVFLRSRLSRADTVIANLGKRNGGLKIDKEKLGKDNQALTLQVAKEKGEKYKFLMIGFGVGVGITVVLGVAGAMFFLSK